MNTQSLLDRYFEVAFSAPEGVKRLRELILNLAMRGLLVPQDPTAQPARELLREIEAEKDRLIRVDGLKTAAKITINKVEEYIKRKPSWEYIRLGNLAKFIDYRGKTPQKVKSGIPLITAKNVRFGFVARQPFEYISRNDYENWMTRGIPRIGDLLFTTEAPLGNVAIVDIEERFALAQRVICLQLHKPEIAPFLKWLMMSTLFQNQLKINATGMTAKGIKSSKLKEIPIPLPPLEEQKRIVEKVDRLMEQCDRLEQLHKEREQKRIIVHAAARDRLLNAKGDRELQTAWEFLRDRFGDLYAVKENISELRKVILQFAVMGKLVPQDPTAQPARELLREIEAEKDRLIRAGKLKKSNKLPEISPEEIPYELPDSWLWCYWNDIALKIGDIDHKMPAEVSQGVPYVSPRDFYGTNEINFQGAKKISADDFLKLSVKIKPEKYDLIFPRYGTLGVNRLVLVDIDFLASYSCAVVKNFHNLVDPKFSYYYSISPLTRSEIERYTKKTTQANVGVKSIQQFLYPLPPLEEQKRIVEKVDHLMELCDQLESQIDQQTQTQTSLLNTLMSQLS